MSRRPPCFGQHDNHILVLPLFAFKEKCTIYVLTSALGITGVPFNDASVQAVVCDGAVARDLNRQSADAWYDDVCCDFMRQS